MAGVLHSILARFPRRRVLIAGDVMLDEYLRGAVQRISPEAPVPVVQLQQRSDVPGGAANTAANVAGLQAHVHLAGVVGDDDAGQRLRACLAAQGIAVEGLFSEPGRPSTTKTRIIAHGQQVVRVDHEQRGPCTPALEERLLRFIEKQLPQADACILSDYAKGVVSPALARRLLRGAAARGKPVLVDPKGPDFSRYQGATLLKPNLHETALFLQREVSSIEAGQRLLALLGVAGVLITPGAAGMSLFQKGAAPVHIPAQAREVFDVTGAGDAVAATLAVALAAGAALEPAARLASRAAGLVVGRLGTTPVRFEELWAASGE